LKILLSVARDISGNDGTSVRAKRIFEVLNEKFDVKLLGYKKFKHIPVIRFFPYSLNLVSTVIKYKFDYIYCCDDRYGFLILKIFQGLSKYKIIYEAHAIESEEFRSIKKPMIMVKFINRLEKFVASHSNHVITLSKNTLDFFKSCNNNIELIPVFLDSNLYQLNQRKRRDIRQKYKISDSVVLGLVGPFNIVFNKHFLHFLYENINRFDKRIKFMVIGNCHNRIENDRIIYTGYIEDYIDHLACLDGVVVPSKIATTGPLNKILEPMSLGLAVFTTPAGLVGLDYPTPEKDLFVSEEKELVDKIHKSIFDNELIQGIGRNARQTVKLYYSKQVNAKKVTRIFESEPMSR